MDINVLYEFRDKINAIVTCYENKTIHPDDERILLYTFNYFNRLVKNFGNDTDSDFYSDISDGSDTLDTSEEFDVITDNYIANSDCSKIIKKYVESDIILTDV